jgi:hypothetical protein
MSSKNRIRSKKKSSATAGKQRGARAPRLDRSALQEMGWLDGQLPAAVRRSNPRRELAESAKRELVETMFGPIAAAASPLALTAHIPPESDIIGIGFGLKQVGQNGFEEGDAIRVYVRRKHPRSRLRAKEIVPMRVNGIATDVIEMEPLQPHQAQLCGGSVGSLQGNDGTLGCLVQMAGQPGVFLLSSNHVIADLNDAQLGAPIFAPGLREGGDPNRPIATLTARPALVFGGPPNYVDLAIAALQDPQSVVPEILGIGRVQQPIMQAFKTETVKKHGLASGNTLGVVVDTAGDMTVAFDSEHIVHYTNQLTITNVGGGPFSDFGDSGSLVLDAATGRSVGMINAGNGSVTIASHIDIVLEPNLQIL